MKIWVLISLCVVLFAVFGYAKAKKGIPGAAHMAESSSTLDVSLETAGRPIAAVPSPAVENRKAEPVALPPHYSSEANILQHCPVADGFAYPVGAPDAAGYRDVRPFGVKHHLGEDWNGGQGKGGNGDLGDPIYSIADGIVTYAEPVGKNCRYGWGNVVKIVHNAGTVDNPEYVESLYAHLDRIQVTLHQHVKRGEQIGTMGTCSGVYWSHLHFELRSEPFMSIGRGYAVDKTGYLDPKKFIEQHRFDGDKLTGKPLFAGRPTPAPR